MIPQSTKLISSLRQLAESAAREGGAIARAAFGADLRVERKADGSEVTQADVEAQDAIVRVIRASRPNDRFLTEEVNDSSASSENRDDGIWWIIDPIDGTRNFIRGVPLFACSVAACTRDTALAGAIYWVAQDSMYSASIGGGASCNGNALANLTETRTPDGRSGRPVVGVPSSIGDEIRRTAYDWIDRGVVRNLGSTALHLALVAAGGMDATMCSDSKLWDIAAGWVMIHELGGLISTPDGRPIFPCDIAGYDRSCTPCIAIRDKQVAARLSG